MEKIMAVYDVDPAYARRFADVTNQKERVPFDVIPFTSMEALQEYGKKHKIEILLISSTVPREQAEAIGAGSVVTLAEGEIVKSVDSYPSVYKYQAADSLIREVIGCYCESPEEAGLVVRGKSPDSGDLFTHWQVSEDIPGTDAGTAAGQRREGVVSGTGCICGIFQIDREFL